MLAFQLVIYDGDSSSLKVYAFLCPFFLCFNLSHSMLSVVHDFTLITTAVGHE